MEREDRAAAEVGAAPAAGPAASSAAAASADAGQAIAVLLNPRAAGGRAARLAEPLRIRLAALAPQAELATIDGVDAAREWLRGRPRQSRVALVGGDGTVHRLLPEFIARGLCLGVVPVGSGNDFARALGVDRLAWEAALAVALRAPSAACDVGELEAGAGRVPFASSLAAGFDAAIARRAHEGPPWLGGLPRYLWATLRELARLERVRVRATIDGALLHDGEALFASTLNTPTFGAGMPVVPDARIDDGRLDLLLAGRFGRAGALAMLPRLLAGRHVGHPRVRIAGFRELRVEADAELPLAADGEPIGAARTFTVRVRAGVLEVAQSQKMR